MTTLVLAYLLVWLAVVLYIGRLGFRQNRLERALHALGSRTATANWPDPVDKAA
jgi:CcmD family protein